MEARIRVRALGRKYANVKKEEKNICEKQTLELPPLDPRTSSCDYHARINEQLCNTWCSYRRIELDFRISQQDLALFKKKSLF